MSAWVDRYVDSEAMEGDNGESPSEPWTLEEAITNKADHQRVNIKAGTYYVTGQTISESNYWWRGYNSTPGDLDNAFVGDKTSGSNIPEIQISSGHLRLTGSFNLSGLVLANSSNSDPTLEDDTNMCWRKNVKFIHTGSACTKNMIQTNSSVDDVSYVNCEFRGNDCSSGRSLVFGTSERHFIGCVFRQTDAAGSWRGLDINAGNTVTGCLFEDVDIGVRWGSYANDISNCTFVDIIDNAIDGNASSGTSGAMLIRNNYFHSVGGYCIGNNSGTTANKLMYIDNNTHYNCSNFLEFSDQQSFNTQTDSSDPFEDKSSGDYRLKSSSNAYELLQGGFWRSDMANYRNGGAAEAQSSGGGGGSTIIVIED